MASLHLDLLEGEYAVWKLPPEATFRPLPGVGILSITRTPEELSGVSLAHLAPPGAEVQAGWRCLRARGPLPFELTGILASLAAPLAAADISIFALSTFDTDYVLVPVAKLDDATAALRRAGHEVEPA